MCFSAEVSFGASAVVGTVGVISISKSVNRAQRLLSCIPLIFAVRQFSEGVLWVTSTQSSLAYYHNAAMYTFLVFAQVVWPAIVPLAVMLLEENPKRKLILKFIVGFGMLFSLYLIYCLINYKVESYIIQQITAANKIYNALSNVLFSNLFIEYTIAAPLMVSK